MSNKKDHILGIILILSGIGIFLLNTNILPEEVLLLVLGVGFLVGYYYKKHTGFLIVGLILMAVGTTTLIDEYVLTSMDLTGVFFMWGIGIVFLFLYLTKDIKGFVYPGCILPGIGTYSLLDELYNVDIGWAFFLLLGLSFYLIYAFENRRSKVRWPLIPGTVLLVLSVLLFLASEDIITSSFWRVISYGWPIILILIGGRIIYNNIKLKQ